MIPPTLEEQRQALRDQLIKEFNQPEKPKTGHKPSASLSQKKPSTRAKFLKNPNTRPEPGDSVSDIREHRGKNK
jgi:hypothetical protein